MPPYSNNAKAIQINRRMPFAMNKRYVVEGEYRQACYSCVYALLEFLQPLLDTFTFVHSKHDLFFSFLLPLSEY